MLTWTTSVYRDRIVKTGTLLTCNYYQDPVLVNKDCGLEEALLEFFPGVKTRSFFVEDVVFSAGAIEIVLGS